VPRPPKIWRRKDRRGWWATIAGKQVCLGDDRAAAEREWHRRRASALTVPPGRATVAELIDGYLEWVEPRVKPGTYENYRGYLQSWILLVGRLAASSLTIDHVERWVNGQAWSQSSRNLALGILRGWARWCDDRGYALLPIVRKVKRPAVLRRKPPAPGALDLVLGAIRSPQFRDFVQVMLDVGCRPGEAASLSAAGIDWEASTAWVTGKTGRRLVGLSTRALAVLERLATQHPTGPLLRNRNGDPWQSEAVCQQFWRACERVRKATGRDVRAVVAYHLRHAFWGRAHKAGLDSIVVARQMGHTDLSMLAKFYAEVEPEMLRDVAQKASDNRAKSS
jgi:integrase